MGCLTEGAPAPKLRHAPADIHRINSGTFLPQANPTDCKLRNKALEQNISRESVSKTHNFCYCNDTCCVFLIYGTRLSGIQSPVALNPQTNGPSCNKSHNFGLVFNGKMQLNKRQNAGAFVIFIEPEVQEANSFVHGASANSVINYRATILNHLL